jgi:glycerol-3-phosphate dehydrogenase subunit B
MLDLLVIGAGLAGLTAAMYAAQAGLSVRVVTKGLNALHWSAATIDLLGYLPDNTRVDAPFAALDQLPASHPLRQVGKRGGSQASRLPGPHRPGNGAAR